MYRPHLVYLFIYQWILVLLLWLMLLWTRVLQYLFKSLLSILLHIYPEVELLDCMVILFLSFWGAVILFSTAHAPFYNLTNSAQGFQFLHSLTKLLIFCFACVLIVTTLMDVSLPASLCFPLWAPVIPNRLLKGDLGVIRGKFPFTKRKGHFLRTVNSTESLSKHDGEVRVLREEEEMK